ncbi:PepSY-associated TM helix domain-containing protein [Parvularcula dongshanensis]|uniref:Putative iron-regulated membrane protein n=1 Tax=Parvularcula dongshanensis TaxID=1173995 RepID=A0A840I549_9PROT|nr:PepSY domain-containing protein [Parvularcula dongshanensis]MBB4660086.1 putative iron-regulated membrane protein [Parvularcula dongshanensis]
MSATAQKARRHYAAVWRWHLLAGLVVIPFLVMASLTGAVMVLKGPAAGFFNRDRLVVPVGTERLAPAEIVAAAQARHPHASAAAYLSPHAANRSVQVHLSQAHGSHAGGHGAGRTLALFVDPYTGEVLAETELGRSLADLAETLHGTLFLGAFGDVVIEVVAGFSILMILTGLYLYWPARGRDTAPPVGRAAWRRVHGLTGWAVSLILLFFLVSGLAWTPVWGEKLTQAWGAFPAERFAAPASTARHAALDAPGARIVPWALERTPLPRSSLAGGEAPAIGLGDVVRFAEAADFDGYRVLLPRGEGGTYTVSATTMAGDIANPMRDRTMHIDPVTGTVIGDVAFADYSLGGKVMAASIAVHQGNAGALNVVMNLTLCAGVLALSGSALVLWWKRRPARGLPGMPKASAAARRQTDWALFGAALLVPATAVVVAVLGLYGTIVRPRRNG